MASEEVEEIRPIPGEYPKGAYLLLFDPLDGSSNIDVNISVGTIFSVLRCPEGVVAATEADFMQPGSAQVAGYSVYGPSTQLVLTVGDGEPRLHAGSGDGQLHLHPPGHEGSGGHRIRHQRVERAFLGGARPALRERVEGRVQKVRGGVISTPAIGGLLMNHTKPNNVIFIFSQR